MAWVVFLRGVNVGGHKAFQPSALARELAAFGVVNVGAAGTFVVRKTISQAILRAELLRRLPFQAELMICRSRELIDLTFGQPSPDETARKDVRRFVSVLARRPRTLPRLPISHPAGDKWQVKVIGIRGRFALSLHRRQGRTLVYPNEVVEKRLRVTATTRNWNTIAAIRSVLEAARISGFGMAPGTAGSGSVPTPTTISCSGRCSQVVCACSCGAARKHWFRPPLIRRAARN